MVGVAAWFSSVLSAAIIHSFVLKQDASCPKNPWDVMGCQVATCLEALFGVSLGGSGVSIGGVRSLRVLNKSFNRFVKLRASVLKLEVRRVKPSSRFQTGLLFIHSCGR